MDKQKIEQAVRMMLEAIGEDPDRPGLVDTPRRISAMYEEIFSGLGVDAGDVLKEVPGEKHDEIVLIRDIPFYSVCEHHLLPFIGRAHVAYLPDENIVGLSKIARVLKTISARPQLQERLTTEVAEIIMERLKPKGVMVVVEAEHLCMTMRGVKSPGSKTVTSAVRGIFRSDKGTRSETLALINNR